MADQYQGTARPDLLAAVEQSPRAAAAHDRAAWVGLFTADGRVEDPVGSRPHVGRTQIGRFYDTFIGPRDITFHRDLDIVRGAAVVRDLELEVAMGPAVTMHIPAVLRYDLRQAGSAGKDEWKIARLRAYWELPDMMLQFLRNGTRALPAGARLSKALLSNQRLAGTAGFVTGFRRPGRRRKQLVTTFIEAIGNGDTSTAMTAMQVLSPSATLTYGDDVTMDPAEFSQQLDGVRMTKMVGAGSTVAVSVRSQHRRAVLFAEPARRGDVITAIRYFPG